MVHFPISGVETYWWLPALVAFCISALTSMGGVSGAFLILPFQVSILGFTGPAVSPTNLVFNIVAIPSGVYRYVREKRMLWPLAWTIVIGTLPGVFIGAVIRIKYLPDPHTFKIFAGAVLLYIGIRLFNDIIRKKQLSAPYKKTGGTFNVAIIESSLKRLEYRFENKTYSVSNFSLMILSFIVGIVGGTYGIGGGAIIAPFLVAIFGLPVHTIAGAALFGTFVTSIAGVIFYSLIALFYSGTGLAIAPDWILGLMFGIGGAAGMYVGARIQKFIPGRTIKLILALSMFFIALKYITAVF